MALDLDDIAGRYNIANDGSRPGDSKSLADTLAREDAAYQEAISKLGGELFQTDSTVSDTGQYNRLTNPTQTPTTTTTTPQQNRENSWDGYYVYDTQPGGAPSSFTRNLFGANLDVALNAALDKINFEPGGDGSLTNSIAYIRPWSRGGATSPMQVGQSTDGSARNNALGGLLSNLWDTASSIIDLPTEVQFAGDLVSDVFSGNVPQYVPKWNEDNSVWDPANLINAGINLAFDDKKGNLNTNYYNNYNPDGTLISSLAQTNQNNLKPTTPINWSQAGLLAAEVASGTFLRDTQAGQFVDTALDFIPDLFNVKPGPVFSGNLRGLNVVADNWERLFGLGPKIPYEGKLRGFTPPAYLSEGVWQFMFNPSQLNLSLGPNFKEAETWGVTDEPNAGKPLHFTSYKNPELKFSKVLLNGYVFGRQVEALEQGLIELFMKTPPGESKHGPQVLEFVWGKKSFGPCVMKDVRITEKMWDQGLLVNAEVDFTLVRVPEWTINDGLVSTFDPSAQNTIVSPDTSPNASSPNVGIGSNPPSNSDTTQPPPAPSDPTQKDYATCKKIGVAMRDTVQLLDNGDYLAKRIKQGGNPLAFIGIGEGTLGAVDGYDQMLGYYNNWTRRVQQADSTINFGSKCSVPYFGRKRTELLAKPGPINSQEKQDFSVKLIGEINSCINSVSSNIANSYAEGKCFNFEDPKGPRYVLK